MQDHKNIDRKAPVNVVYLVSTLRQTGPTSQLLNIISGLDQSKYSPVIVTISNEPAQSMKSLFTDRNIAVVSLGFSRLQGLLHLRWRSAIEEACGVKLDRSSVLHSQGVRADLVSALFLGGVIRLSTARNYPHDDYVMKFGSLIGSAIASAHLAIYRRIPHVVACSSFIARRLIEHGIEAEVIRNAVDTNRFHPASDSSRTKLKDKLGFSDNSIIIVCVGALSERKNPGDVIDAFEALSDRSLRLLFLGDGELAERCKEHASRDSRIIVKGLVSNVVEYLQISEIFVSASHSEGFPNSVLEAVACGLPVVLSDIEPHRELVSVIGDVGNLFEIGNRESLKTSLQLAVDEIKSTQVKDRRMDSNRKIGADHMSERYQTFYDELSAGTESNQ